ncbi:energy-coupling factor transporter transmembrane component T family protein [Ureibacillus sp. GCM10028918]|uniref:energy-coupling factor transporter transmembrane component T family protein n=1 Tax=Ureibacillus sp. GCM10028918 TaxID=3273429 RepID=UPI00361DAAA9
MFLHQLNPTMKALTIVILVVLLALVFDPVTPTILLLSTLLLMFVGAKVNLKKYFLYFLPFILFSFGMFWTTLIFGKQPDSPDQVITILIFEFPRETFIVALALAVRVLSVAALSLLFIFTTNIVHFILSLIQQLKLSPRIAYGVLAGYRFLPMMKDELKIIREAHRIRGVHQATTIRGKWSQYKRYAIPLLASAIRKAERTATAMESKGFTGERNRTFLRQFTITKEDWLFLVLMLTLYAVAVYTSSSLGFLKLYNGEL